MKVLGIIPARGGSKGIPKKNITRINGKPLIAYTVNEAKKSKLLYSLVVSTEDSEIVKISKKLGVTVIKRPKRLSADSTSTNAVVVDTVQQLKKKDDIQFDAVAILQPTSPLRTVVDIDNAIKIFKKNRCDSVMGVTRVEHPPSWIYQINKKGTLTKFLKDKTQVTRRQDSPVLYRLNGAILVATSEFFLREKTFGSNTIPYVMPQHRSIDIDSYYDLKVAEMIMKNKKYFKDES